MLCNQLAIGHRMSNHGELADALEKQSDVMRTTAIEAELELVQVGGHVFAADRALICSQDPSLQQVPVRLPLVRFDRASFRNIVCHERLYARRVGVVDPVHPQAASPFAVDLNGNRHNRFFHGLAPNNPFFLSAHVGLVHLHQPLELMPVFWVDARKMALNHRRRGLRDLWNMVPAVKDVWQWQRLHPIKSRSLNLQPRALPHLGQRKPFGQRTRMR